ncbi:MAG: hypothetical protein CMN55_01225 [Sneathiella sp.]|jgi:hypothetical protein|uniref:intermembrane phospholipid transport protein YdbH family protein n=1 Tax=Sneathiella sp. TaxID=1964365 RepID=UPI000C59ABCA|nr:YdbH domain-containing protein [Sneathiella sp.]MAL77730.1 hypothetical protein [Sneathiella sp.]
MAGTKKVMFYRRPLFWVIIIPLILLAGILTFRLPLLEAVGKTGLSLAGFEDASLNISEVSSGQAVIRELSLGRQVVLRDMIVRYDPLDLLRGQIAAIDIGDLELDLSNPEAGVIARFRELAQAGEESKPSGGEGPFPAIYLERGRVVYDNGGRFVEADIAGALTPDMALQGEATITVRVEADAGAILLQDMRITLDGDLNSLTGHADILGGELRQDRETPDWQPFRLSGKAELKEGLFAGQLSVATLDDRDLLSLEGRYDLATASGQGHFSLVDLTFRKAGFQPSDLTHHADVLPSFDGILNVMARVEMTDGHAHYELEAAMTDFSMAVSDGMVISEKLPIRLTGEYVMDELQQQAEITLPESNLEMTYQGRRYALQAFQAKVGVRNFGAELDIQNFEGVLADVAEQPDFTPLAFTVNGRMETDRQLEIIGSISNPAAKITVDASGWFNLPKGNGAATFTLPETKIGKGGVNPVAISRHLAESGKAISGAIKGDIGLQRQEDGRLLLSSLKATVQNGGWRQGDVALSGVSFELTGQEGSADQILAGALSGRISDIEASGQKFSIPSLAAAFTLTLDNLLPGSTGQLDLTELHIKPGEGAIFREEQRLTGKASFAENDVRFTADVSSGLLGTSYVKMKGHHSLATGRGEAGVMIAPLLFAKDGLQPMDLFNLALDMALEGQVAPSAKIAWSADRVNGSAELSLDGLSAKLPGGEITGIEGDVHIDELFPLTISKAQEIRARLASAGIPLNSPFIRFRLLTENENPVLYIDRMTVGLVGGSAIVEDAKIDTGAETNRLDVRLSSLDLKEVMALSSVEDVVATGHVSGRIPLIFGGERLIVENGELAADGPGVLKMSSAAARQALGSGGEQAKLVLDILENFQYSDLSIAILKTESGVDTVKLHAAGSNPEVENNRPVVLNINLETSLDKIFNAVLDGYLLSEKALRATVRGR